MTEQNLKNVKSTLHLLKKEFGTPAILFAKLKQNNKLKRKNDSFYGHYHDQPWKSPFATLCGLIALVWNREGRKTLQKNDWTEQKVMILFAQSSTEQIKMLGEWAGYIFNHLNRKCVIVAKLAQKAKTAISIIATTAADNYKKESKKIRDYLEFIMTKKTEQKFSIDYVERPLKTDPLKREILEALPTVKRQFGYKGNANDLYVWIQNKVKRGLPVEEAKRDVMMEIRASSY